MIEFLLIRYEMTSHSPPPSASAIKTATLSSTPLPPGRAFDAIRSAWNDSLNLVPSPLPPLSRSAALDRHTQGLARESALDARREVRTRRTVVGPGKAFSSRPLDELEAVGFSSLRCDEVAKGKGVICRVISSCFRTVAVQLVVEDAQGRIGPLSIHHLPARLDQRSLNDRFAVGATFALKEPLIRATPDGYLVRIDSPADFVRLLPSSSYLAKVNFPQTGTGSHFTRTALGHKDEGNRLFAAGRWEGAEFAYALARDALVVKTDPLLPTVLSNIAITYLRLDRPAAALEACCEALELQVPLRLRLKLLYRAALASYTLQEFTQAANTLEELLGLEEEASGEAQDLYRRTQVRLVEASRGEFDWPHLWTTPSTSLDVADFTGSMFAAQAVSGKGRGLVATRRIEPGELILLRRPLASGRGDSNRTQYVVGANWFTNTMDPYGVGDLVAQLIERAQDQPSVRRRVLELYAGPQEIGSSKEGIDVSCFEGATTFNAFLTESLAQKQVPLSPAEQATLDVHASSSLYDTASLMNHSCIGNVSYSFLADTIFLRARRPILAGEELVDSYADSMAPLAERREVLEKHGFVCGCELCCLDRADGEEACHLRQGLADELAEVTDRIHGVRKESAAALLSHIEGLIHRINNTYHVNRGPLRPALYSALRLHSQALANDEPEQALRIEIQALEALGAVFDVGAEVAEASLREVPKVGDMNSVLSSLFISKQLQGLGQSDGARNWIRIARRIERGQAGEALFELRYAAWAEQNGLVLSEEG